MKNARSALYPVRAKWKDIGIELDIDIGTLDSIERSCHFQDNNCLTRMLDFWFKQTDPSPSWDAIVEALESGPVGEGRLAEQIKWKYCTPSENRSECVPPPQTVTMTMVSESSSVAASTTEYVRYLKALYTSSKLPSDNKWPPTPSKHYIKLALIDKQRVTRHEADEFTRYTIKGNIDDICHKKEPITIEKVACMQEDPSQVEISYPKLVIVTGAPGVGKSTFSWELCRKWANGELLQHFSLVILLRLRDKNVRKAKVLTDILFHGDESVSTTVATEIRQRNGEGILFVLDGFDELPESMRSESSLYLDLIYGCLLPLATVLVTSRPWAISDVQWTTNERISQQLEILGFTKQQIDEYLISITIGDSNLLGELRRYVSLNPPIHAAMYIPLNAAIVFAVYKDRRGHADCVIPNTMTELYTAFSRTLLIRYLHDQGEKTKNLKVASFENLPKVVYKKFLGICELAFRGLNDRQLVFSDLPDGFETLGFMQSVPDLHCSSGVSISYNFLHLTIQEFLAAYYLSDSVQRAKSVQIQIQNKSVTRFLAGITKLNDPAILPEQLPKYNHVVKIEPLLGDCENMRDQDHTLRILYIRTHDSENVPSIIGSTTVVEYHVCLSGSAAAMFYEGQNKTQLEASIGTETAFLMITSKMTPMDCFAAGWCIGSTVCKWKLCLSCNVSPDCIAMLHAGVQKCHPSYCEVCELDIGRVSGSDDSVQMFFDLQNAITFNIKRFVCLEYYISSQYVASFCTQIKKLTFLDEVILDIACGSMEANAILDVVLSCGTIGSLTLGDNLSEHFIKRNLLTDLTIPSLSLYFSSYIDIKTTDMISCTTAMMNFKSLQFLAIHRYPFYMHGMLLEQLDKDGGQCTCSRSDAENLASYATSFPRNSGEMVAHLLQGTSNLKVLTLQNCSLDRRDTAIITQAVKHNKVLLTLDLSNNNCSRSQDAEVDPFADMLRVNQTLQVLRLCGSFVDADGLFKVLADNENTTLETLDVRDNNYSIENLQHLLMNNISLQHLQITVTDSSKHHVPDLAICWSRSRFTPRMNTILLAANKKRETISISSVCSTLITALSNNTTIHDLMIHATDNLYDTLICTMQQCQGYDQVKERIKVFKYDESAWSAKIQTIDSRFFG